MRRLLPSMTFFSVTAASAEEQWNRLAAEATRLELTNPRFCEHGYVAQEVFANFCSSRPSLKSKDRKEFEELITETVRFFDRPLVGGYFAESILIEFPNPLSVMLGCFEHAQSQLAPGSLKRNRTERKGKPWG